mgnify:CR=1 FL=1
MLPRAPALRSSLPDITACGELQGLSSSASLPAQPQQPLQQQRDGDVILEFRDVHKSFGTNPILRGATFKIRRGEAVGIIGSSGTGKSTTLRLAAGLLAPDKVGACVEVSSFSFVHTYGLLFDSIVRRR